MSPLRNARNWLDERFGWDDLVASLRKKSVPLHRLSYWYFLGVAGKNLQAGQKAMAERNYRRAGLGISLIAIALMLVGLRLYIKRIER